jgi:polyhydroxyalkanoate synthesis repressor PhaR
VLIKRYASRKLYDPQAKVYVTLDDVARYIREGHDVRIVDNKTEEDLTSQYLIQIIAERENKGDSPLPVAVLTDLVRLYQDQTSALTPTFLSQAVDAFTEQQENVMRSMTDPAHAMGEMRKWQARQAAMFAKTFGMGGIAGGNTTSPEPEPTEEPQEAKAEANRIDALEAQLASLQDALKGMSSK